MDAPGWTTITKSKYRNPSTVKTTLLEQRHIDMTYVQSNFLPAKRLFKGLTRFRQISDTNIK